MARSRHSYDYTPSFEATVKRADDRHSQFDNLFKDIKIFKAKEGQNGVRICPPTWQGAGHYGKRILIHSDIGPRNQRYLCLRENDDSPYDNCPVCDELKKLGPRATLDDRKALQAKEQVVYYVLSRNAGDEPEVMVWLVSPTTDSEIAAQSVNRRRGSVLNIIDVDDGYDIEFTRKGTGRTTTRYSGYKVDRDSSPLHEKMQLQEEAEDFINDNPLPTRLNFVTPERMTEVLFGTAKDEDEEKQQGEREAPRDDRRGSRRQAVEEEEEEQPRRTRNRDEEEAPRQRTRTPPPADDEEEEQPRRTRTRTPPPEDDEEPAPRRARGRTPIEEEIDDEIPEKASGRRNGRDNGEDPELTRAVRRPSRDEEEEPAPRRGRGRGRVQVDDEEEEPAPRRTRTPPPDDEDDRRSRLRDNLNRR